MEIRLEVAPPHHHCDVILNFGKAAGDQRTLTVRVDDNIIAQRVIEMGELSQFANAILAALGLL